MRITTWNVNGIRNPFGYQPWNSARTFPAMFDILEADIVIMQELKIQRKDLTDDMVLLDGWDCYFSLPKHKKGYSGVGIYTRNAACSPIRAEEGVLGVLCPPGSKTAFRDLPEDQHIGGYPTAGQIADLGVDPVLLDSEGRCMCLEFPAFVIFGVYSPANSNGLRDDFRYGFLCALDCRIRNLIKAGKQVILCGDLNVSRGEIDTASAAEENRKAGITHEQYISTPNRRVFNQLIVGGEVVGERDENRETAVLHDLAREFHPDRKGMYTHWEQKINARPGNFGSRIDFVLVSAGLREWFCESDIQEGLMGSDHCPVYGVMKDTFDETCHFIDFLNPSGMFVDGIRQRTWSVRDVPATSGKLLPEFDKRRSIRDMFAKPASSPSATAPTTSSAQSSTSITNGTDQVKSKPSDKKRKVSDSSTTAIKRNRISSPKSTEPARGQKSLKGFFAPKTKPQTTGGDTMNGASTHDRSPPGNGVGENSSQLQGEHIHPGGEVDVDTFSPGATPAPFSHTMFTRSSQPPGSDVPCASQAAAIPASPASPAAAVPLSSAADSAPIAAGTSPDPSPASPAGSSTSTVHDPIVSKESWNNLFRKPVVPLCEGHAEPCKMMLTKKKGENQGRSFYMCVRPLGPSGNKERGTQWRCPTFIWCSDFKAGD